MQFCTSRDQRTFENLSKTASFGEPQPFKNLFIHLIHALPNRMRTFALSIPPLILLFLEEFARLGLPAPILKAIGQIGFETPSEIQEQAIPHLLGGDRDFIGLAQTGTGKTAAFGLPLLSLLDPANKSVQALVLAPTRELGQQIAQQIHLFAAHLKGIETLAVYGGANISEQIRALKSPRHVVIATPGRLIDLVKRKAISLESIQYLVLDEADEMLNMGFKEELDTILSFTPETKQTWLFSATMPTEIRRMVKKYMDNPVEVRIDPKNSVNTNIDHRYALVRHTDKTEAVTRFLDMDPDLYGLVFCRTKRDTQNLAEELLKMGYRADALHGDLSQPQRDRVMKRFKNRELQVLIATDVAARGIDVDNLTHVFHHSLPEDKSYYTHRSGRTARAGKTGMSLALINTKEKSRVNRLAQELDIEFSQMMVPSAEDIVQTRMESWAVSVLTAEQTGRVPEELLEQMELLFSDISKEELVAKLVAGKLSSLNLGSGTDLNKRASQETNERSRGGGGYANRGSGGYDRGRSYGGGSRDSYPKKERDDRGGSPRKPRPSERPKRPSASGEYGGRSQSGNSEFRRSENRPTEGRDERFSRSDRGDERLRRSDRGDDRYSRSDKPDARYSRSDSAAKPSRPRTSGDSRDAGGKRKGDFGGGRPNKSSGKRKGSDFKPSARKRY